MKRKKERTKENIVDWYVLWTN